MSKKRKKQIRYLVFTLVPVVLLGLVVFAPTVSSAVTVPDTSSCAECHNDTTLITGRKLEWAERSVHGTGTAYLRGTSASCAGCHSGGGFSAMVAAGQEPNTVTSGDPHPTRQDCRACHQIHVSYTGVDWALETTAPVVKFAAAGTYDGGRGNLCAKCHQGRRDAPVASGGVITGISTHWGPHHGPQSDMMLGIAGAGVTGSPSGHYNLIGDTCVACHVDRNQNPADPASGNHTFEPDVSNCQTCHAGATNFDINGRQTSTQTQLDAIGTELVALGYLSDITVDGHPTTSSAPENIGIALWNWLYIGHEDKSLGVHNANYTQALLDESAAALGLGPCTPAKPSLALTLGNVYWVSYADYMARELSVDFTLTNNGANGANNVALTGATVAPASVSLINTPYAVGYIGPSAMKVTTVKFYVPMGVAKFTASISGTADDVCDGTSYPMP